MNRFEKGDRVVINNFTLSTYKYKGTVLKQYSWKENCDVMLDDGRIFLYKNENLNLLENENMNDENKFKLGDRVVVNNPRLITNGGEGVIEHPNIEYVGSEHLISKVRLKDDSVREYRNDNLKLVKDNQQTNKGEVNMSMNFRKGDRVVVKNPKLRTNGYKGTVDYATHYICAVKLDCGDTRDYKKENLGLLCDEMMDDESENANIAPQVEHNDMGFSIKENKKVTYTIEVDEDIYKLLQWFIGNLDELDINDFVSDEHPELLNNVDKLMRFVEAIHSRRY